MLNYNKLESEACQTVFKDEKQALETLEEIRIEKAVKRLDLLKITDYYKKNLTSHLKTFKGKIVKECLPRMRRISTKKLKEIGLEVVGIHDISIREMDWTSPIVKAYFKREWDI